MLIDTMRHIYPLRSSISLKIIIHNANFSLSPCYFSMTATMYKRQIQFKRICRQKSLNMLHSFNISVF